MAGGNGICFLRSCFFSCFQSVILNLDYHEKNLTRNGNSLFFACHVHVVQAQEILFQETFGRLNSPEGQWADLDVSQLDHPSGWDFDRVHAGPQCLVVEEGGSFTLPAIPQMMGNASIYISVFPWQDDDFTPCKLSVSEGEVEKPTWVWPSVLQPKLRFMM